MESQPPLALCHNYSTSERFVNEVVRVRTLFTSQACRLPDGGRDLREVDLKRTLSRVHPLSPGIWKEMSGERLVITIYIQITAIIVFFPVIVSGAHMSLILFAINVKILKSTHHLNKLARLR